MLLAPYRLLGVDEMRPLYQRLASITRRRDVAETAIEGVWGHFDANLVDADPCSATPPIGPG